MSPGLIITWLGYACFLGAAVAFGVYVAHLAGRQGWKRPWNAAGLVFTSVALSQTPFLFQYVFDAKGLRTALIVTLCLLAATTAQSLTALRRRRQEDAPSIQAASPASPQGLDA